MDQSLQRDNRWGFLAGLAAVTAAAAFAGSQATVRAPDFYHSLSRPDWAPPSEVFGPVWTILYIMMAVSAWLVVRARGWPGARAAIVIYLVQLTFNALWSWLFFGWQLGAMAFAEVALLLMLIGVMVKMFWRESRLAGILLLPYLGWVAFATALTFAIWRSNPGVL